MLCYLYSPTFFIIFLIPVIPISSIIPYLRVFEPSGQGVGYNH